MKTSTYILFLAASVILFANTSCTKQEVFERPPAYHITQSEQLEIPATVALTENSTGYTRVATFYAVGVQKYKAQIKAGSFPESYEWIFVAPLAELYDISNKHVGLHGAGPFWTTGITDSIFAQH